MWHDFWLNFEYSMLIYVPVHYFYLSSYFAFRHRDVIQQSNDQLGLHIPCVVPGLSSQLLCFKSSFLLRSFRGGNRWQFKHLGLYPSSRRPGQTSGLLILVWSSPSCLRNLRSESVNGGSHSLCLFVFHIKWDQILCFFNFRITIWFIITFLLKFFTSKGSFFK